MIRATRSALFASLGGLCAAVLISLLIVPLVALAMSASPADALAAASHPMFAPALWLSLRTTLLSLAVTVVTGTPLAWWLASSRSRLVGPVEVLVQLPIVIPPAVVGVALLQTFGRRGALGPALSAIGLEIPFTEVAVVLAQIIVSAPFFVQAAANAFRDVDPDALVVARTLGASRREAFLRVALPVALPGVAVGASLAWARSLGEFGATILFAGNMTGVTQTMPLAIFSAMESDVRLAVVFSLLLAGIGAMVLMAIRLTPTAWRRLRGIS